MPRILAFVPLMLMPWLFGGADPSMEGLGLFWTAGTFLIWLVTVLLGSRRSPVVFPVIAILVSLGIGLGVCQFLPWPAEKLQQIAPGLTQLLREFQPGDEMAEFPELTQGTQKNEWGQFALSPNPAATRHAVAVMVWALASFLIGANLFADPKWSKRMLVALAINGSLVAFFGIFQALSWNGALYWTFDLTQGGSPFGPFVNKNNGGGFLNLTFGCAVAALAMAYSTRLQNLSGQMAGRSRSSRRAALRSQVQLFFSDLNARQLASFSMVLCIMTAILFTLSRGTIVAFLITGGIFLWLSWRLPINRIVLVLIVVTGLGGLAAADLFGFVERWEIRIQEALEVTEKPDDRFHLWKELLIAAKESPWVGTGAGSLRYVVPMFHQRLVERNYFHAENQYLETWLEFGVAGTVLLGGVLLISLATVAALRRRCASDLDGMIFPVYLAGCVALFSQMVGGAFDFGLMIPANMITMATLIGMMSGAWIFHRKNSIQVRSSYVRNVFRPATLLLLAVGAGLVWSVKEERDAVAATMAAQQAMYEQIEAIGDEHPYPLLTLDVIDKSKAIIEKVLLRRPDDMEARYQLGQLWLLRYQMVAFEELKKERASLDLGDVPLWNLTDISLAQMSASGFAEEGDAKSLEELRKEAAVQENLRPALEAFITARRSCGWSADLQLHLGWLSWIGRDPLAADEYVMKAVKLAPNFAQNLVDAGTIEFNIGKLEAAEKNWKKAIELRPETFEGISNIADTRWTVQETMRRVIPLQTSVIVRIARSLLPLPTLDLESRETLATLLEESLTATPAESRNAVDKSVLARLRKDLSGADKELQAAIKDDGKLVQARYDRAEVLLEMGQLQTALDEVTVCRRLEPRNSRCRSLETRIRQAIQRDKEKQFGSPLMEEINVEEVDAATGS